MLLLCLLLLAIVFLSGAICYWLGSTILAGTPLRYIYATVAASVFISLLFDISVVAALPGWSFIVASLLAGAGLLYYEWKKDSAPAPDLSGILRYRADLYSIVILGLICYLSYLFIPHSGRWGRWDAKAIWTLHALFLTYPYEWTNLFSPTIAWSHPDYPLLLSSLIAMCWRAMGTTGPVAPCVIAYIVFVTVLLTICTGLGQINRLLALVGLVLFAFANSYIKMAASQGADTLLSLFILMALVLVRQHEKGGDVKLIFLTGFISGFAGWIKNEGIAFTIVFSIVMMWQYKKAPHHVAYYTAGLLLPVLVIIVFKTIYAPANDIMAGQNHNAVSRLMEPGRYKLTGIYFLNNIRHLYPGLLIIVGLVIITGYRRLYDSRLLVIMLMIGTYFFTFVITPRDLRWHLENASDRLLLQLFPSLVYVLLSLVYVLLSLLLESGTG